MDSHTITMPDQHPSTSYVVVKFNILWHLDSYRTPLAKHGGINQLLFHDSHRTALSAQQIAQKSDGVDHMRIRTTQSHHH